MTNAPEPITPLKGVRSVTINPKQSDIDWFYWVTLDEVKVWEAAFLVHNSNPKKQSSNSIYNHGIDNQKISDFSRLLLKKSSNRELFSPGILNIGSSLFHEVKLSEVANWCLSINYDIPDELKAVAKSPIKLEAKEATEQDIVNPEPVEEDVGRRDRQIKEICKAAIDFGYFDLKNIAEGGKTAIKSKCLTDKNLFTNSGFDHAWKEANRRGVIAMQDKEKYS